VWVFFTRAVVGCVTGFGGAMKARLVSATLALVTVGALLGASMLLTACGQQLAKPWSENTTDTSASAAATVTIGTLQKPTPVPMGTTTASGKWKLVVSSATRSAVAAGMRATGGREMLVVTAELTNGAKGSREVSSTCFVLADEGGTVHKPVATNDPYYLYDDTVTMYAGATKRIVIAYAIPKGVGPFNWTFTPSDRIDDSQAPAVLEVK
jgi:hypothetical protein